MKSIHLPYLGAQRVCERSVEHVQHDSQFPF